ncbi:MAG: thioredoxin family protein [Prevotellaceae bacterium]|nr:thioredoxin family protein [Prevotellaceae bacterium]
MKKLLLAVSILCLSATLGLSQGVKFEEGTWAEVVAKAKAENKPIFVDLYATWCGPCKVMAKNTFTDNNVGNKFNASFISYRIDAEKGEGLTLVKKYPIKGYPTCIFVNPSDEKEIYRFMGARTPSELLEEANKALEKVKK